jgi:NAD(P)H-hydrate repair Nnr-like enzyme with NAD(P)H-hydrate dehydratase domain
VRLLPAGAPILAAAAADEAVWLHGRAAALAGPALIADTLADAIPAAVEECL